MSLKVRELLDLLQKAPLDADVHVTSNARVVRLHPACIYEVALAEIVEDDLQDKNGPWVCLTLMDV